MDDKYLTLMAAQVAALGRIATALESIAGATAKAPNYAQPIEKFKTFDFGTIGAVVKAGDKHGPTAVEWQGFIWTRRSPSNNFGEAIWFSRPEGKKPDGSNNYIRLITFRKFNDAKRLPEAVRDILNPEE